MLYLNFYKNIFIHQLHNGKISLEYFRINICKNLLTKKYSDLDGFINRFSQTFKKEVTTVLYKFYQRTEIKKGEESNCQLVFEACKGI